MPTKRNPDKEAQKLLAEALLSRIEPDRAKVRDRLLDAMHWRNPRDGGADVARFGAVKYRSDMEFHQPDKFLAFMEHLVPYRIHHWCDTAQKGGSQFMHCAAYSYMFTEAREGGLYRIYRPSFKKGEFIGFTAIVGGEEKDDES